MTIPFMGCTLWQIHSWTLKKLYFLVETNLPTPMTTRVCVNFLEGNDDIMMPKSWQHDDEIYNGMMLDDGGYEWYSDHVVVFLQIYPLVLLNITMDNHHLNFQKINRHGWLSKNHHEYINGQPRHWFVRCL